MREERQHIEQETVKLIKAIERHQYSPSQMHWAVQVAIIPIFRYSAALAGWTEKGIYVCLRLMSDTTNTK